MECERSKPHVVLLDLHLGGDNDAKLFVDSIRRNNNLQFTKVIAMSGKLTDGQTSTLRTAGYDSFLKKPFQVRQVIQAIESATNLVA
jgi:DNA-binding response OmpR family regulator